MSTVIKLKRGTSTPTTSDIVNGEVALDISAKKLFVNDSGTIKEIGADAALTASQLNDINVVAGQVAHGTDLGSIGDSLSSASGATNITTVADDITNVNTVAGQSTQIGRLGTADAVADMNTLGTTAIVSDLDTLADISSNITTVAGISSNVTSVAGNATNINAVKNNATNINTVAGISGNITTVAGISANVTSVKNNATNINTVAGQISNNNLQTVAADIAKVVTAANDLNETTSEIDTVANAITNVDNVGNNIANVNTVAGISANVTTVAGNNSNVTAVAGNNSNITAVAGNATNINAVKNNATNINAVNANKTNIDAVAGNNSNITAVKNNATNINAVQANASNINAVAGNATNINTVASNATNINTTASNISNVNNFASTYQIASSAPTTDGGGNSLAEGDLYFDTTSDELKIYNGSSWQGGVTAGGNFAGTGANQFSGNITFTGNQTVDGRDLSVDGAKLDGIETGATADQTKSDIDALNINADTVDSLHASSFLRSDADDSFSGTIIANSDASNPVIKIQGSGPNFIRFASDSSGTVDADSIDFVYRSSPNSLNYERASDSQVMFSVDADNQQATFAGNLDVGQGLDVTGNISASGTIDGRDVASDGSKLDGIESGATGDQTASEIVSLISGQTIAPNAITTTNLTLDFGTL